VVVVAAGLTLAEWSGEKLEKEACISLAPIACHRSPEVGLSQHERRFLGTMGNADGGQLLARIPVE